MIFYDIVLSTFLQNHVDSPECPKVVSELGVLEARVEFVTKGGRKDVVDAIEFGLDVSDNDPSSDNGRHRPDFANEPSICEFACVSVVFTTSEILQT